jgi:choline transport protein
MQNMAEKNEANIIAQDAHSDAKGEVFNADDARLQQMGHTQELSRHFSTLSLIGLASTCTISWTGLGLGLATEIGAGGPGAVRMARVQMIQVMNH